MRLADFIATGWRFIEPYRYLPNWHIEAVSQHLEAVSDGQIERLIINEPPFEHESLLKVRVLVKRHDAARSHTKQNSHFPRVGIAEQYLAFRPRQFGLFPGKLSDIHGRQPMLLIAIAVFVLGSLAAALANSMTMLIVARGFQGLGGGGLMALGQTIVEIGRAHV